ncbi:unnamed protein product [Orchesella dallaii]|uniref:Uncharacterized protein n=1 Tax=Orchesella dallaii TaxID=48710 RepID=A0ABP1R6G7_9HEXA
MSELLGFWIGMESLEFSSTLREKREGRENGVDNQSMQYISFSLECLCCGIDKYLRNVEHRNMLAFSFSLSRLFSYKKKLTRIPISTSTCFSGKCDQVTGSRVYFVIRIPGNRLSQLELLMQKEVEEELELGWISRCFLSSLRYPKKVSISCFYCFIITWVNNLGVQKYHSGVPRSYE